MTARGRRFEARADFAEEFEETSEDRDVVQRLLAEEPALKSWQLVCRSEVRSIAPSNAIGVEAKQK